MKKINFILLAALLGMLTSCGVGVYYPNAHNVFGAQTTVHLDKANFRVVRDVEAVVAVTNTNLSRSSVEKSAYGQLLRNAKLTGSQVLINVVIEEVQRASGGLFRWAYRVPKIVQYVAARATIIEFLDENGNPTISQPYHPINTSKQATNNATDIVKTDTTNSQPKQPQTSNENNIEKIQSIHLGICRIHTNLLNLNIHHLDKVFQIYTTIYRDLPRTNENIIMLQKIQFVITMYLNTIGKGCPTIEEKLKNAASMEEQINIFLSYY